MSQIDDRLIPRCHQMLLRLAGWVPDRVTAAARVDLAEGRLVEMARVVGDVVLGRNLPIFPPDAQLLVQLLPEDPAAVRLMGAAPASADVHPAFDFAPVLPGPFDFAPLPLLLDLTGSAAAGLDPADAAAVAALDRVPGAAALWRVWRSAQPDRREAGSTRVYLLAVDADPTLLPGATAWLQETLVAAGVTDPQVESFGKDTELPAYQRQARGRSALLWASARPQSVGIARVFDSFHPTIGGQFAADHPVLSGGDEAARVLRYLEQGTELMATTARADDVLDPGAGAVVPMSFRTDGRWIWTDAVSYYLRTHALSPDEELLAHIRAQAYRLPEVDLVAEHRASVALLTPEHA